MDLLELLGILIPVIIVVIFFGRRWIRTINTAYSESTLQGLLCLFPLYAIYYAIKREWSDVKSVIMEFLKAGAARNVEAAYACCSPQSPAKEEISKLIERSRDVFAGYERVNISSWSGRSDGGISEAYVKGAIIYTVGQRLPLEAHLVKENDVWKIIDIQIGTAVTAVKLEWWRDKKKLAIIGSTVVVVLLLGVMLPNLMQFFSGVNTVIAEFMEAGAARNVEAACACWSPQSGTEGDIAEYIESNYEDVFEGYERVDINSRSGQSGGDVDSCHARGAIIYTGGKRVPLEAQLVKENDVWKITGIQIGSAALFFT